MSKVYAFLAPGLEEVECLFVVDILRRANVEVVMVSMGKELLVRGAHQIGIEADCLFDKDTIKDGDLLFLPGGMPGAENLRNHEDLNRLLIQADQTGTHLAAICAAPIVFGSLGLLNGKNATCYPGYENQLTGAVILPDGVVTDGHITTARGLGFAMDLGLELVRILVDEETSSTIRSAIQHNCL